MRHLISLSVLCVLLLFLALPARATPEYAERTRQACSVCHRDPSGSGPLTPTGELFVAGAHRWPIPREVTGTARGAPAPGLRLVRFGLGFLHLSTAVVWFGAIFYVHIVLRPKYALGGLPKAELKLAWACMAILGATGVPLTYLRFHSLHALLESRSGKLLLVKMGLYAFLVCSAAVVTLVVGPRLRRQRSSEQPKDGREGRPAWVQVGDRVYDVTQSPRWKEGNHVRRHQAGSDLTDALVQAPHGPEKLKAFPSWPAEILRPAAPPVVRVFYAMAYLNLFVALGVLVIIALWRWG